MESFDPVDAAINIHIMCRAPGGGGGVKLASQRAFVGPAWLECPISAEYVSIGFPFVIILEEIYIYMAEWQWRIKNWPLGKLFLGPSSSQKK